MTTKIDDPTKLVSDAEQEAAEADALIEALEERVREGDDTVTPDQIEAQRGVSRFARLRADAARRKAAAVRETKHDELVAQLREDVAALNEADLGAMAKLYEGLVRDGAKLQSLIEAWHGKRGDLLGRSQALGFDPESPASPVFALVEPPRDAVALAAAQAQGKAPKGAAEHALTVTGGWATVVEGKRARVQAQRAERIDRLRTAEDRARARAAAPASTVSERAADLKRADEMRAEREQIEANR